MSEQRLLQCEHLCILSENRFELEVVRCVVVPRVVLCRLCLFRVFLHRVVVPRVVFYRVVVPKLLLFSDTCTKLRRIATSERVCQLREATPFILSTGLQRTGVL